MILFEIISAKCKKNSNVLYSHVHRIAVVELQICRHFEISYTLGRSHFRPIVSVAVLQLMQLGMDQFGKLSYIVRKRNSALGIIFAKANGGSSATYCKFS